VVFPLRRLHDSRLLAAALAVAVFLTSWGLLHVGFYTHDQVTDVPVYETYGHAIAAGKVPYRDFDLEYPPGALPVFAVPAAFGDFGAAFGWLMAICGAAAVALVALAAGPGPALFAAVTPLLLGSVMLTRFDLWPAALTAAALAALLRGRDRLGHVALGLAVAAKLYPAVLVPLALAWAWKRRGLREAKVCAAIVFGVVTLPYLVFAAVAPQGVWHSVVTQGSRPLQIESLGSGFLLAAHQAFGLGITMRSGHGSQNLAGAGPDVIAVALTVLQVAALVAVWVAFARGPADRARLVRFSAAAVCVFIALGKVLSPQFLIWLVPLVPLVRRPVAWVLFAAALVLTQLWFPYRYWDLALHFDPLASWLVLARDLVLVALLLALTAPGREAARS